jgi:hypothetical protein
LDVEGEKKDLWEYIQRLDKEKKQMLENIEKFVQSEEILPNEHPREA